MLGPPSPSGTRLTCPAPAQPLGRGFRCAGRWAPLPGPPSRPRKRVEHALAHAHDAHRVFAAGELLPVLVGARQAGQQRHLAVYLVAPVELSGDVHRQAQLAHALGHELGIGAGREQVAVYGHVHTPSPCRRASLLRPLPCRSRAPGAATLAILVSLRPVKPSGGWARMGCCLAPSVSGTVMARLSASGLPTGSWWSTVGMPHSLTQTRRRSGSFQTHFFASPKRISQLFRPSAGTSSHCRPNPSQCPNPCCPSLSRSCRLYDAHRSSLSCCSGGYPK